MGLGAINIDDNGGVDTFQSLTLGSASQLFITSGNTTVVLGTVDTGASPLQLAGGPTATYALGGTVAGSGAVTVVGAVLTVNGTGTATVGGAVTFGNSAFFQTNFGGASASDLVATGNVDLGTNTALKLNIDPNFNPVPGKSYVILETTGGLVGQFQGLPDGSHVSVKGNDYVIRYVRGGAGQLDNTSQGMLVPAGQAIASSTVTTLSLSPAAPFAGDTVVCTANVATGAGSPVNVGTVTFSFNGDTVVVALVNGAALTSRVLQAGSLTLTASFVNTDPTKAFAASSAAPLVLQVVAPPPPPPPPPIPKGVKVFVAGADAGGGPNVSVFNAATNAAGTHDFLFSFFAYDPRFTGGVRVAVGDVNADGNQDIVCVAGPGGGPNVSIFSGADGSRLRSFFAYDQNFTGGVYVAVGDVNGDGFADISCGADAGGGPNITIFSGKDNGQTRLASFFAYDQNFTGGVRVAAGDVNGDGRAEVIAGAGPGGGPNVTVFALDNVQQRLVDSYFAFDPAFAAGIFVSSGDVNRDGKSDVLVGAGPGGGPNVATFRGFDHTGLSSFNAFDPNFIGGVRVAAALQPDGSARLVAVEGPQIRPERGPVSTPEVRIFDPLSGDRVDHFFAFDAGFTGGLYVAGSP